jgi:hypothetical protein
MQMKPKQACGLFCARMRSRSACQNMPKHAWHRLDNLRKPSRDGRKMSCHIAQRPQCLTCFWAGWVTCSQLIIRIASTGSKAWGCVGLWRHERHEGARLSVFSKIGRCRRLTWMREQRAAGPVRSEIETSLRMMSLDI